MLETLSFAGVIGVIIAVPVAVITWYMYCRITSRY